MPLPLPYKRLQVFTLSKKLVAACYALAKSLPQEESGHLADQLRSASVQVYVNVASAIYKKEKEKKRLKKAATALIVLDAIMEVLTEFNLVEKEILVEINHLTYALQKALAGN